MIKCKGNSNTCKRKYFYWVEIKGRGGIAVREGLGTVELLCKSYDDSLWRDWCYANVIFWSSYSEHPSLAFSWKCLVWHDFYSLNTQQWIFQALLKLMQAKFKTVSKSIQNWVIWTDAGHNFWVYLTKQMVLSYFHSFLIHIRLCKSREARRKYKTDIWSFQRSKKTFDAFLGIVRREIKSPQK